MNDILAYETDNRVFVATSFLARDMPDCQVTSFASLPSSESRPACVAARKLLLFRGSLYLAAGEFFSSIGYVPPPC